ncbi:helix-turn-helix domain-containing protein [Undibacterium sp. SXout11W]|uniref:helix-turn-helix domain-containing protein n=1 Tax=Undibacterium sp. SXout11W TaxID=3413050 RepID=UPI003BF36E40
MPIIVNLDVVLAQRKMRLNTLSAIVGITVQNLSVLKTGKAKAIRFDTLEKICGILNCQPGDILAYTPDTAVGAQVHSHDLDSAVISEADDQIDS